ncbi:MAG: hypothetical protein Q7R81_06400 [Candidatus Peregrinibacteria bacterium]|nr:hypothetical protein [Candidatus Peregrinibacteria bacterium]
MAEIPEYSHFVPETFQQFVTEKDMLGDKEDVGQLTKEEEDRLEVLRTIETVVEECGLRFEDVRKFSTPEELDAYLDFFDNYHYGGFVAELSESAGLSSTVLEIMRGQSEELFQKKIGERKSEEKASGIQP